MLNENFSERAKERVFKYINGATIVTQKDLVVVLEAHLLFENLMDEILKLFVSDDDFYKDIKLRFSEKIKIIKKRKIVHSDLIVVLEEVNRIRNIFAHNLGTSMEKDIDLTKLVSICKSKASQSVLFDRVSADKKALFAMCSTFCLAQISICVEDFLKIGQGVAK